MKKLMSFILLFNVVFYGFSQTDNDINEELLRATGKTPNVVTQQADSARITSMSVTANEMGLNIVTLAAFQMLDITYEYIDNLNFSFGLAFCFSLADEDYKIAEAERYAITPFFRYYFFNKKEDYGLIGFYAETFLKFFGGTRYDYDYRYDYLRYKQDYIDAALGVGLGCKFVSRSGFVLDLNVGLGRSFGLSDFFGSRDTVRRGGVIFGYRF